MRCQCQCQYPGSNIGRGAPPAALSTAPHSVPVRVQSSRSKHTIPSVKTVSDVNNKNGCSVKSDLSCEENNVTRCQRSVSLRYTKCRDNVTLYCGRVTENSEKMSGNNRINGFQRNSYLRRSDSYRRAKNVMSPDLSKNHRKSVEVVTLNNNSSLVTQNNLTNTTQMTGGAGENESADHSAATIITSPHIPAKSGHQAEKNQGTKNNFFKSLRSSFSFSSLRVKKSQPRPSILISSPLEASQTHYQVIND